MIHLVLNIRIWCHWLKHIISCFDLPFTIIIQTFKIRTGIFDILNLDNCYQVLV